MNKKIYLITGVSSGLGKALAEAIIDAGNYVIGTLRSEQEVIAFNTKYEGDAEAIQLDITDLPSIESHVKNIIAKHSRIDFLINNAGVGFSGAIEEASIEEVREVFEANFFGTMKLTQAVLPYMREKKNGSIIQVSSHAGVKAFAGFGIYNASKFALEGFSEALAQEVKPLGLKVIVVEPGPFRTNFAGRSLMRAKQQIEDYSETAGKFRMMLDGVHGKQEGDPNKAAAVILKFINSDSTSLRLPLGTIPLKTIGAKIESLQNDLNANRALAIQAVF